MKAMTPTLVAAKSIGTMKTPNQPNGTGGDETEDTFSDLETNEPKIDPTETETQSYHAEHTCIRA